MLVHYPGCASDYVASVDTAVQRNVVALETQVERIALLFAAADIRFGTVELAGTLDRCLFLHFLDHHDFRVHHVGDIPRDRFD